MITYASMLMLVLALLGSGEFSNESGTGAELENKGSVYTSSPEDITLPKKDRKRYRFFVAPPPPPPPTPRG